MKEYSNPTETEERLKHSMIDERTRRGWVYYAQHRPHWRSNPDHPCQQDRLQGFQRLGDRITQSN